MIEANDWLVSSADLQMLLGVDRKQLSRWHQSGMPKVGRGTWDLRVAVQWVLAHAGLGEADEHGEQNLALGNARQSLVEAQHRKLELEIERLEGAVYDAEMVHQAFDALAVIVTSAHNALPSHAPEFIGKDVDAVEELLEEQCRQVGQAISNAIRAFRLAKGQGLDKMDAAAATP